MLRYVSPSLQRTAFQACSFNHSDISPSLESRGYERSASDYPTRPHNSRRSSDHVYIQRFRVDRAAGKSEIVSDLQMSGSVGLRISADSVQPFRWTSQTCLAFYSRRCDRRARPRAAIAIPQCVLPAVDRAVIPAQRALPDDVAGGRVELRDDDGLVFRGDLGKGVC
jgi:hypothetical protein